MLKSRELDENNLIWGAHASKILGISKLTFDKRILMGAYKKVHCKGCPGGWKYSIFDIFKIAHPRASDYQIETFIREFRDGRNMKFKYGKKIGG